MLNGIAAVWPSSTRTMASTADNNMNWAPDRMIAGLAIYARGHGEAILLFPYPHGFALGPMIDTPLSKQLQALPRRVLSFDAPGMFGTTRPAKMTMGEMMDGASETLNALHAGRRVDIVGHSMGGLCALAFALTHPKQVDRLILVDSLSGGPAIVRHRGLPFCWPWSSPDTWRYILWGTWLSLGQGSMALHKRMTRLIWKSSYVDKALIPEIKTTATDRRLPAPIRDRWPRIARHIDYCDQLHTLDAPTLICVGRFDPQTPVACSQELVQGIANARLVIFEESGHYPFVEEPLRFQQTLAAFLGTMSSGASSPP